jgi:hypothetical protein
MSENKDTKRILDEFAVKLKQNRNLLNEDDYPKSHQDGWHFWNYWDRSNTSELYKVRLTKLWDMSGRSREAAQTKAFQLDMALVNYAKELGYTIVVVNSEVTMENPDRSMYNAEIRLIEKVEERDERVPVKPDVEKDLKKHGFTKQVWNGVINEWSKNLRHRPGKPMVFSLRVRFGEWKDVQGGMVYLYSGNSFTSLPHVQTLDQILEVVRVLTTPHKK